MNPKSITVRLAEQKDKQQWDAYVLTHPEGGPYHLSAWKLAVEEAYGHRCYYLCAELDGSLAGILPLVHIYFPGIVNELSALPYCDVGNCLCENAAVQDALLEEALNIRNKLGSRMSLRGPLLESGLAGESFHLDDTGKVRMLLQLPSSSEELFAGFKSKLRSQVRKAEKNGISFRWGGLDDLDTIYSVFSRNMHDLGSPVHSRKWLRSILEHYKTRALVGLAEFERKTVGIGVILTGNRSVSIPWASTLREYNRLGPNMLLYWNILKFSADNGFQEFDFGRSTEGEGTYRFKSQWGACPVPLPWYSHGADEKADDVGKQGPGKRDMAAGIWQKIPLPVATFVGSRLRKYISL